ncbi:hypothetical protein PLEOSDRAFT_165571 [Pleurotus ostreatus PC15]|uniref:DNA2/NAM7 helicase helicase domain-containing protein n=1 Tax=Pleurotus ostreatus (strain PC15) TaxID=1137138 RepID=A0A067P7J1_PLEO1|nr:hypothetical protein PLEOSDRAFT_165571 [Pleurotus ostreatus PC15]
MTASTHNAVDNVLERFIILNKKAHLLTEDQILRVATDQSKVNKSLQHYTIDAPGGRDLNENNKLAKQALARVKSAVSTVLWITMDSAQYRVVCPGAGLGILRKVDFEIALIDKASQITEPCALIPLVKGVKRAVLVGDHPARTACNFVQRFGTWRKHWSTCLYLRGCIRAKPPYGVPNNAGWEFYEGKLQSAITNSQEVLGRLEGSSFPWPRRNGYIFPTVFIQCSTEEDLGGASKANAGENAKTEAAKSSAWTGPMALLGLVVFFENSLPSLVNLKLYDYISPMEDAELVRQLASFSSITALCLSNVRFTSLAPIVSSFPQLEYLWLKSAFTLAFGLRMLDTVKTLVVLVVVDVTSLPIHHTIQMYNGDYRGPAFHRAHEWKRWWEDTGRAVELASRLQISKAPSAESDKDPQRQGIVDGLMGLVEERIPWRFNVGDLPSSQ